VLKQILNLVGWLGAALVLAAVALRFLKPEQAQWYRWLAIAGLVCTLLYLASQWREIGRSFARRQVRYSAISIGSVLLVLAILTGINWIAARQSKRWDLTTAGQFTLSDQTRKILASLKEPVNVKVFAGPRMVDRFRDRMTEYDSLSDQLKVEYIEPLKQPALANQYEVQQDGTVVFEYKGRIERTTSETEQDLTNAIVKVTQGEQSKVYFVQGHQEHDTTGSEGDGYSTAASALQSDNFVVEKVVLAQQSAVPADADVLVIAGPQVDYLPTELDLIRDYLKRGGKLLLMLDPPDRMEQAPLRNLLAFAREWGIEVGNNVVVDANPNSRAFGAGPATPLAASYPPHPITERLETLTAYHLVRSVAPVSGGTNGRNAQTLVETGPASWAETDFKALTSGGAVSLDEGGGDKRGPISIAAAVSATAESPEPAKASDEKPAGTTPDGDAKPESRVAVFGDSDFAANSTIQFLGNRDLFLNTVNWLAQQENMISIRPKEPSDRRLTITADQSQRLYWLSIFIIPGLIIAAGVREWWRRR
jgi:ABC-type uncharacterized transport system involved in gliding motility auxiliary subunit